MKSIFFAFLFCFLTLGSNAAVAGYSVNYRNMPNYQLITFEGEIPVGVRFARLRKIIKRIHGRTDLVLKVGESGGGYTAKFKDFIRDIKKQCARRRGRSCHLTAIFTDYCASACTYWPLMADYSVATPGARFGFHRTWMFTSKFTIQSKRGLVNEYIRLGGDPIWFRENLTRINSKQEGCYWMSNSEEIASGLIDEHVSSYHQYIKGLN